MPLIYMQTMLLLLPPMNGCLCENRDEGFGPRPLSSVVNQSLALSFHQQDLQRRCFIEAVLYPLASFVLCALYWKEWEHVAFGFVEVFFVHVSSRNTKCRADKMQSGRPWERFSSQPK